MARRPQPVKILDASGGLVLLRATVCTYCGQYCEKLNKGARLPGSGIRVLADRHGQMDLEDILKRNKSSIINKWFEVVIQSYPEDTAQFLRRQKDAMANPVGASVREGMDGIMDGLIQAVHAPERGLDRERMIPFLDRIVRIRALQKFTPSESLTFIPALKGILRKSLKNEIGEADHRALDDAVDEVLWMAFDVFVECRERLHDIRVRDEQRRLHMLLRQANLICETEGDPADLPDSRDSGHATNHEER